MNKIYMEKENIARIIFDVACFLLSVFVLFLMCLNHYRLLPIFIACGSILLFSFSIFVEFYECIFYDDTHFVVRSVAGSEKIEYSDIERIERKSVWAPTGRGGQHSRYYVQIKTNDNGSKQIIVPFPNFASNKNLQDLFKKIKNENSNVQWINLT